MPRGAYDDWMKGWVSAFKRMRGKGWQRKMLRQLQRQWQRWWQRLVAAAIAEGVEGEGRGGRKQLCHWQLWRVVKKE